MASWRLAPTLVQLRSEVNERWPIRDKTSDGTLGDASHAARGKSDHNPDARGVVCAIDLGEDLTLPAGKYPSFRPGEGAQVLLETLLELLRDGKLPQVYYLIYEGKIYSRTYAFRERDYSGANPHDHHIHISVYHDARLADSTTPWGINDMPLSASDLDKVRAEVRDLLLDRAFVQEFLEILASRDGVFPNSFPGTDPQNSHLTMRGVANEIGNEFSRLRPSEE